MNTAALPPPRREEEEFLNRVIDDWSTRTPIQRAICICISRGAQSPEKVAGVLGITREDVQSSLKSVWGVLYDSAQNRYWFK
jgi:hypothetical protein